MRPLFHPDLATMDPRNRITEGQHPVKLETDLGYNFTRPELLQQALTHRSAGTPNYERLEFLGDSVLNCTIATYLYRRFDGMNEGEMSRMRASLVREETLVSIAQHLALGDKLRLGAGEAKNGGARRPSILADAVEAVFGAILMDGGFDAAQRVIERLYEPTLARIDPDESGKDPKTALQEFLQGRHLALPRHNVIAVRGDAHAQEFEAECVIASLSLRCTGIGTTRRTAEQQAARQVINSLRTNHRPRPTTPAKRV
jgi:ribonuclease-3